MIEYGTQRSAVKPDSVEITDSKVFVYDDIEEITNKVGEEEVEHLWQFTLTEYEKNEYITLMSKHNDTQEEELTSAQMALCELYELIGG